MGLLARLCIGEYGLSAIQATSKLQTDETKTKVSIGSVLRVVLLRAALNGEETVDISLGLTFRMIRFSFPLLMSSSADDRLCLDIEIRCKLIEEILELFQITEIFPFLTAIRHEQNKTQKKIHKEFIQKKNLEFSPQKNKGSLGRRGTLAKQGFGKIKQAAKMNRLVEEDDDDDDDDGNNGNNNDQVGNIDSLVEQHDRNLVELKLMKRVQEIPDKTRKLLLTVADNSKALRNLFAIFDEDNSGGVSGEELRIALSQFGILLNRKETKHLISIVDQDDDGELQFTELLDFVDAISKDEERRKKEIQAKQWNDSQALVRKERREAKQKRKLRQHLAATAAGESASQFFNFVNVQIDDDSGDDTESESDDDGGVIPILEDCVCDYLEQRQSHSAIKANLFNVVAACLKAFNRQEAENASRLLAFYRKYDLDKSGDLDFEEFGELMKKLSESSKENMSPEEVSELYIEAATLTPDNTRVDDQKFLLIMMSKGFVPSPFEDL